LYDAKDALCGGELNFVYGLQPDGRPAWASTPQPESALDPTPWKNYTESEYSALSNIGKVLDGVIKGFSDMEECKRNPMTPEECSLKGHAFWKRFPHAMNHTDWGIPKCCIVNYFKVPDAAGTKYSVQQLSQATLETLPAPRDCRDQETNFEQGLRPADMVWGNAFVDVGAGDGTCGSGCPDWFAPLCKQGRCKNVQCREDVAQYCRDDSYLGNLARWNCPETCSCANFQVAGEEGSINLEISGCPSTCSKLSHFVEKQDTMPCKNSPFDDAAKYAKSLQSATRDWPASLRISLDAFALKLAKDGCEADTFTWGAKHCGTFVEGKGLGPYWQSGLKPLSNVCPVSCRCIKGAYGCPNTCNSTVWQLSTRRRRRRKAGR